MPTIKLVKASWAWPCIHVVDHVTTVTSQHRPPPDASQFMTNNTNVFSPFKGAETAWRRLGERLRIYLLCETLSSLILPHLTLLQAPSWRLLSGLPASYRPVTRPTYRWRRARVPYKWAKCRLCGVSGHRHRAQTGSVAAPGRVVVACPPLSVVFSLFLHLPLRAVACVRVSGAASTLLREERQVMSPKLFDEARMNTRFFFLIPHIVCACLFVFVFCLCFSLALPDACGAWDHWVGLFRDISGGFFFKCVMVLKRLTSVFLNGLPESTDISS